MWTLIAKAHRRAAASIYPGQLHGNVDAAVHLSFEPKHYADGRCLIRPRQRAAMGGAVHHDPGTRCRIAANDPCGIGSSGVFIRSPLDQPLLLLTLAIARVSSKLVKSNFGIIR